MMNNTIYQTVIVGGGFAGLFTALHLSHQHYPRSVILIEKEDRFCFKPLLYEYFSGEMGAEEV
ncbi:FAD-dependent oxidoreductase [Microcoleus sp. LEGE 07076]|nr:FAD-dependent oxidoreductase [Microcoleus sp. LEGE 07076]